MLTLFYILSVIVCCILLFLSAELLTRSISRISKFLGIKEFVVAFFMVALAGSLPNLFVGVSSALRNIPELSFGDVVGGSVFDLTVTAALAVLFAKGGISARSRTVQTSAIFTMFSALLPLILILDKNLSRIDGVILISFFLFYTAWLFHKKERFTRIYEEKEKEEISPFKKFKVFIFDLAKVILGLVSLLIASNLIIEAASALSLKAGLSIALIGIFIVGMGNCLPELYFVVSAARKGKTSLIFGDLMGAVIIPPTLVLGIVAIISPFSITDFSIYALARIAVFVSAIFFLIFIRSDKKVTRREAGILLAIYIIWLLAEIVARG